MSGHQGREKTYASLAREFYWCNQYKWVRKVCRPIIVRRLE
ncbi:hypothetical protein D7Y13_42015 [Corallococcus praedator]|uniref:Integrase zinc-binding domain-containing protein n=1 Tax=Corallococcus praedator TaxID=2316724 RepID=A0ABX9Q368_9BACT|nr:hypothetical protein D7Y13_42015 [Corallococcus praedator]